MKKKTIKTFGIILVCVAAAWLFLWTITPFDELTMDTVDAVEIITASNVNGGSVTLDEDYAEQVLEAIAPIRLYGQWDFLSDWADGGKPTMFYLVLSDGMRIRVGENYPNFVMDGRQYRIVLGSRKYVDKLEELYFAHPDHYPGG